MSYRSHADLGGQPGHGPIAIDADDAPFHAAWEPRALALTLAMGATGAWNIDSSRAARETLADYASLSYYRIWEAALEVLLRERALVQPDEIAASHARHPALPLPRRLAAADVERVLRAGAPTARPAATPAAFAVGQAVRTRAAAVPHHTRLPGYARGKRGVIERCHGVHVFADAHAHGLGEQPQWLYSVAFAARDLWPDAAAAPGDAVCIDAWEPYLEAA